MTDDNLQASEPSNEVVTDQATEQPQVEPELILGKFKTNEDVIKSYSELEKRFGGFTGAPEAYDLPEEVDTDDTFVKTLSEIGIKNNMSQGTFHEVLELGEALLTAQDDLRMEREMEALGPEAEQRLANIDGFMKNNLGERYEEFKDSIKEAKTVELIETLIKASAPSRLPTDGGVAVGVPTQGDVERMMMEKDENGKVIYHHSKSRQREVENAIARMKGLQ